MILPSSVGGANNLIFVIQIRNWSVNFLSKLKGWGGGPKQTIAITKLEDNKCSLKF